MIESVDIEAKATKKYFEKLVIKRKSENTIVHYRDSLKKFKSFIGDTSVLDVDSDHFDAFICDMLNNGLSPVTINTYLRHLRTFYNFAVDYDYISKNPMNKVDSLKEPSRKRKYLEEAQIAVLLERCTANPKYEFMTVVLLSTGLRVTEFCSITVQDIDFNAGTIRVIGKGDKERIVGLPFKTLNMIQKWVKLFELQPTDKLWKHDKYYTEELFRNLSRWCEFKVTPHMLRHTMATRIYRRTNDLGAIQQILGHSSQKTTSLYAIYDTSKAIRLQQENAL